MTYNEYLVLMNSMALYKSQMAEWSKDPDEDSEWIKKMVAVAGELEQKITTEYKAQH